MSKTVKQTVVRSKTSGRFVSNAYARRYPQRVLKQTVVVAKVK